MHCVTRAAPPLSGEVGLDTDPHAVRLLSSLRVQPFSLLWPFPAWNAGRVAVVVGGGGCARVGRGGDEARQ